MQKITKRAWRVAHWDALLRGILDVDIVVPDCVVAESGAASLLELGEQLFVPLLCQLPDHTVTLVTDELADDVY